MDNRDELSSGSSGTSHDDGTRGKRRRERCVSASDNEGITYVCSPQVCINWRLQPTCSFRCSCVRKRVLRIGWLRTFTTAHRKWSYTISARYIYIQGELMLLNVKLLLLNVKLLIHVNAL